MTIHKSHYFRDKNLIKISLKLLQNSPNEHFGDVYSFLKQSSYNIFSMVKFVKMCLSLFLFVLVLRGFFPQYWTIFSTHFFIRLNFSSAH